MSNYILISVPDGPNEINLIYDRTGNKIIELKIGLYDLIMLIGKNHYVYLNNRHAFKIYNITTNAPTIEVNGLNLVGVYVSENYLLLAKTSAEVFDSYYFDESAKKLVHKSQIKIPGSQIMCGALNDCIILDNEDRHELTLFSLEDNTVVDKSHCGNNVYQKGRKFISSSAIERISEGWSSNFVILKDTANKEYIFDILTDKIVAEFKHSLFFGVFRDYIKSTCEISGLKLVYEDVFNTYYYINVKPE